MTCGPPAEVDFEVELITDTAGHQQTGGSGRSCWGFNQTNIVRHGDDVFAMVWRDDLHVIVFHRSAPGEWVASPPLPECPQNGVLLVDSGGRLHVIGGKGASYHAIFDEPLSVSSFKVQRLATADSRFGASISANGDIFVAGGLPAMSWYLLSASDGYRPTLSGRIEHETNRGYYFADWDGRAAHTLCYDDYRDESNSRWQTLRTYHYYNPDLRANPAEWRMHVVSDVADTVDGPARGATEHEDLLVDRDGLVHFLYMRNATPTTSNWAMLAQDRTEDRLYHAVGPPDGPFEHYCLGAFSRGRLHQSADGRFHYLLERGEWFNFDLYYASGEAGVWDRISEPIALETPTPIDHIFVNSTRAGGTLWSGIDCYFTGPYPGETNRVYYGRITPAADAPGD